MVPDTFSCSGLSLQNRCAGLLESAGLSLAESGRRTRENAIDKGGRCVSTPLIICRGAP